MPICRQKRKYRIRRGIKTSLLAEMGYKVGAQIGQGTYSNVYVATNDKQEKEACKIIDKKFGSAEFVKKFLPRELRIISKVHHPNIVSAAKIVEVRDMIYIFMEFCGNGDLLEYVLAQGPLTEFQTKSFFRQLVSAVEYLHNLNLAHRDLKCENVLLTADYRLKLADFGFSRSCINSQTGKEIFSSTFCGSAAYAAPEVLQGVPYDPKMYDMWSLGCVLYIMLSASMPFDDSNIKQMLRAQLGKKANHRNFAIWTVDTPSLTSLLNHLLEPTVKRRATIHKVVNCKWLNEVPCKKLRSLKIVNCKTED